MRCAGRSRVRPRLRACEGPIHKGTPLEVARFRRLAKLMCSGDNFRFETTCRVVKATSINSSLDIGRRKRAFPFVGYASQQARGPPPASRRHEPQQMHRSSQTGTLQQLPSPRTMPTPSPSYTTIQPLARQTAMVYGMLYHGHLDAFHIVDRSHPCRLRPLAQYGQTGV